MLVMLLSTSCATKYIVKVDPEIKPEFGFEVTAPNKAIFFVENLDSKNRTSRLLWHKEISGRLYKKYGPSEDGFIITQTNARDFKFNLKEKTYYIEVKNLPRRTAMILFDGKHRPIVCFNPDKYGDWIKKILE